MEVMHCEDYAKSVLKQLYFLYQERQLCDVTLTTPNASLQAHKIVLIAASEYFKAELLDNEGEEFCVLHLNIRTDSLAGLVHFLYTGTLRLDQTNVKQVLSAATFLRISAAVKLCERFLCCHGNGDGASGRVPQSLHDMEFKEEGQQQAATKLSNSENIACRLETIDSIFPHSLSESSTNVSATDRQELENNDETVEKIPEGGAAGNSSDTMVTSGVREESASKPRHHHEEQPLKLTLKLRKKSCRAKVSSRKAEQQLSRHSVGKEDQHLAAHPLRTVEEQLTRSEELSRERLSSMLLPGPARDTEHPNPGSQPTKKRKKRRIERSVGDSQTKRKRNKSELTHSSIIKSSHDYSNAKKTGKKIKHRTKRKTKEKRVKLKPGAPDYHGRFKCEKCTDTFRYRSTLVWHKNLLHRRYLFFLVNKLRAYRRMLLCQGFKQQLKSQHVLQNAELTFGLSQILRHEPSDLTYCCCSTYFRSWALFQIHRIKKHVKVDLNSPSCFKSDVVISRSRYRLRSHVRHIDLSRKIHFCTNCPRTFIHLSNLVAHLKAVHGTRVSSPLMRHGSGIRSKERRQKRTLWACEDTSCKFTSPTKKGLTAHMSERHTDMTFTCKDCSFQTQFSNQLRKHAAEFHGLDKKRTCDVCSKTYGTDTHLRRHQFTAHKIYHPSLKVLKCDAEDCSFVAVCRTNLLKHQQKHKSEKNFSCEECGKQLKTAATLEKHIRVVHRGIKPFMCEICAMSYGDESELKMHLNRHNVTKTFQCQWCDYAAFDKGNFKSHLFNRHGKKLEENMKIFTCAVCSFQTDVKYRFNDHMRVHEKKRDIKCEDCGSLFMTRKALRSHFIKVHKEKNLRCDFCGYTTADVSKLREHVRVMHTHRHVRPYQCAYCGFTSATSGNCRKHVMQKHRGLEVKVTKLSDRMPKVEEFVNLDVSSKEITMDSKAGNNDKNIKGKKCKQSLSANQSSKTENGSMQRTAKIEGQQNVATMQSMQAAPVYQSPSKNQFVLAANVMPLYSANDAFSLFDDASEMRHSHALLSDYHGNSAEGLQTLQAVDMTYQSNFPPHLQSPIINYELTPESPRLVIAEDSQTLLTLAQANSLTVEQCQAMLIGSGIHMTNSSSGFNKVGSGNAVNLSGVDNADN